MKKVIVVISLVLMVTVLIFSINNTTKAKDVRYVSVKSAPLKAKPRNFSKTIAKLQENEKLEVLEKEGTWLMVLTKNNVDGYIQDSVVSTSVVGSDASNDLSTGDSSTAGARGFSSEVEAEYKSKKDFDYDSVDKAEYMTKEYPKNPELNFAKFRKNGKLGEYVE